MRSSEESMYKSLTNSVASGLTISVSIMSVTFVTMFNIAA
jgi:hypothetical protein